MWLWLSTFLTQQNTTTKNLNVQPRMSFKGIIYSFVRIWEYLICDEQDDVHITLMFVGY